MMIKNARFALAAAALLVAAGVVPSQTRTVTLTMSNYP